MVERKYNVAVVGASGMVGSEMLKILAERNFPTSEVRAYGSSRSEGQWLNFGKKRLPLLTLEETSLVGMDIVLMSAGEAVSKQWAPIAASLGALVIDNSSAWRMEAGCPLVVPEVNGLEIERHSGIIANPNCCTVALTMALGPLREKVGLKRVVVATYQSASGQAKLWWKNWKRKTELWPRDARWQSASIPSNWRATWCPVAGQWVRREKMKARREKMKRKARSDERREKS
jgi:aspartate-semialdehyde dehydrogenase